MTTRELDSELFGRAVSFRYSEHWVAYAILGMRLVIGWTFFYAGITKVANPDWSVRGFLLYGIPEGNPFTSVWATMANDWAFILTPLNQVGLTLIGLGLMAGAFLRLSAVAGSMMMGFYWAAHFPHDNALIVSQHVVYILLLFGLGAFGAGRILGLDARIEKLSIVQRYPDLRLLLG